MDIVDRAYMLQKYKQLNFYGVVFENDCSNCGKTYTIKIDLEHLVKSKDKLPKRVVCTHCTYITHNLDVEMIDPALLNWRTLERK